jgi:hypothetical protein
MTLRSARSPSPFGDHRRADAGRAEIADGASGASREARASQEQGELAIIWCLTRPSKFSGARRFLPGMELDSSNAPFVRSPATTANSEVDHEGASR